MKMRTVVTAAMVCVGAWGWAQDAVKAAPGNYRVVLEDEHARVLRVHYGAGEKVALHEHSSVPTLYVYLSDAGPVRFVHEGEEHFELVRPPVKAGQWRLSPGRVEKHRVESLSKTDSEFLRVEIKGVPLGDESMHAARGAASAGDAPMERVEFENAKLRIVRVVVGAGEKKVVGDGKALVIALRGRGVKVNGVEVKAGDVWDGLVKVDGGVGEFLRVEWR